MNRTEIEAKWNTMSARERNAWVAKTVMGVKSIGTHGDILIGVFSTESEEYASEIPNYTTDISAAWAVIETSRAWGGLTVAYYSFGYEVLTYTDSAPNQIPVKVTKQTAPEAICLAALIAKLTEVGAH